MAELLSTEAQGHLIAAHGDLTLWAAETTALEAEPYPGEVVADRTTGVTWRPSGTPVTGAGAELRCMRGGYPGRRAAWGWRVADSGDDWYGWDPPTIVSGWELIEQGADADARRVPSACVTALDEVVVAAESRTSATSRSVYVLVRSAAGTWSSATFVTDSAVSDSSQRAAPTVWRAPGVTADAAGRIRLALWTHSPHRMAQLRVFEAAEDSDLTDASSWAMVSDGALDEALDQATGGDLLFLRTVASAAAGQTLLLVHTSRAGAHQIRQYASSDDGISYRLIDTLSTREGVSVARCAGVYVVGYVTSAAVVARAIGDAYTPLTSADEVVVHTPSSTADVQTAILADPAGVAWLYISTDTEADPMALAWSSEDLGVTWLGISGTAEIGAPWVTGRAVISPAFVWWRDRALVVLLADSGILEPGTLACLHLGGWSSHTMPSRGYDTSDVGRTSWTRSWTPDALPGDCYTVVDTGGGTVTSALHSTGRLDVATDGAVTREWRDTSSAQIDPLAIEVALEVTAGTAYLIGEAQSGADIVRARVAVTATSLELYDIVAASTIATETISGPVEVRLWVSGNGVDRCVAWYRSLSVGAPRAWAKLGTSTLSGTVGAYGRATLMLATSTSARLWGIRSLTYRTSEAYLATATPDPTESQWQLVAGTQGRRMSSRPFYVDDGVSVAASGGPATVGDTWSYTASATYAVERLALTSTWPRPATRWRSTDETSQAVAWLLSPSGEVASTRSPIWALWVEGEVQEVKVSWHDGTSWGSDATIPLYASVTCTRYGNVLVPSGSSTPSTSAHLDPDELAGGFAVQGTTVRRISGNEAGLLHAYTGLAAKTMRVVLEGIDGTESSSSTTWKIVWPRAVAALRPPATAKAVRVRFGAGVGTTLTPGGYHEAKVLLGPAWPLGLLPGMDTVTTLDVPREVTEGRSGGTWATQPAPARRTVEITWQNTIDRRRPVSTSTTTAKPTPDYVAAWNTGTAAWNQGEGAGTLAGLVRRWAGAGVPVLYLPYYERTQPSVGSGYYHPDQAARGSIVGTLDPQWRVEQVGGTEQVSEEVRLGSLVITELR